MGRKIEYIIPEEYDCQKVISYLKGKEKISARLLRTLKQKPCGITLNGNHIRTIDTIHKGDILTIDIPCPDGEIEGVKMDLDIIYEDDDIIAVNKSPFLACHPTHNHQGDTLANGIVYQLQQKNMPTMFRAVGRLDKGTSGIVLCALNKHSAALIPKTVKKEYFAVVNGTLPLTGTIDAPIYRPDPMKTIRAVGENGDNAITHWEVIKQNDKISYVKINLETGRTHQIRVHFSSIGHPLVGDSLYGTDEMKIGHQLLHCGNVTFLHPVTGKETKLKADFPCDMHRIIDSI